MALVYPDFSLDFRLKTAVLDFTADDQNYIEVPNYTAINPGGAITVEAWIKSKAVTWNVSAFPVSKRNAYIPFHVNAGQTHIDCYIHDGTTWRNLLNDIEPGFSIKQWNHYAFVFDGSNAYLYVNGELKGSATGIGPYTINTADAGNLFIGWDDGITGRYGNAFIRDVRIWSVARTQTQIQNNMGGQLTGSESGLVGYWKLDEGSGTTATNSVSGGTDGTINGATWKTRGGPFWTDLSADVRKQAQVRWTNGIMGQKPDDRVAGTGQLTFSLDNSEQNSAGLLGRYSPGHANALSGFEIGIEVRVRLSYGGTDYDRFRGRLRIIRPTPGVKGPRSVQCVAEDWIGEAARHLVDLLETQQSIRSDQAFELVAKNVPKQPVAISLSTGRETFDYSLDDLKDERTSALAAFQRIVLSEQGFAYVKPDGTLAFIDRHTRVKNTTVSATLVEADLVDMPASRDDQLIFNEAKAISYPREVDSSYVALYTLQTTIQINPGETKTVKGRYSDPNNRDVRVGGTDMQTPVAGTDYEFSSSTGGGGDMNSDLSVVATFGSNSVEFQLTNNGSASGYVTMLKARGKGIYIYEPVESVSTDADSQEEYGRRPISLQLPYQTSPLAAQDFADITTSRWKDPQTLIAPVSFEANKSATLLGYALSIDPGDRVQISESVAGIDGEYFVNGVQYVLQPTANGNKLRASWVVTPAANELYWLIGTTGASEIGTTTFVGF